MVVIVAQSVTATLKCRWTIIVINNLRHSSPVSIQTQSLALRALRKRTPQETLRWQAANHGGYCFDRAFLLADACVCCVKTQALAFLAVFVYATHATQAIAFGWKPGLTNKQADFISIENNTQ